MIGSRGKPTPASPPLPYSGHPFGPIRAGLSDKLLQFADRQIQFFGKAIAVQLQETVGQSAVIPEGALAAAGEPNPNRLADPPVVRGDGSHIMELVGR